MGILPAAAFVIIFVCIAAIAFLVKRMKDTGEKAGLEIKKAEERYRTLFEFTREGVVTTDSEGKILASNSAAAEMLGFDRPEDIAGRRIIEFYLYPEQRKPLSDDLMKTGYMENYLLTFKKKDGAHLYAICSDVIRKGADGNITGIWTSFMNITRQKVAEDEARNAQLEAQFCREEKTAFLNAMRMIMRYDDFKGSARGILDACMGLVGATSGYIALLNKERTEDKVVAADPDNAAPLSMAHADIYRSSKPFFANDLSKTEWIKQMPENARPFNALLVPVIIKSEIGGVMCLANKPAGFTGNDARLAFIFSEIVAITFLMNSSIKELKQS